MAKVKLSMSDWDKVIILMYGGIEYGYQDYDNLIAQIENQLTDQEY